MMTSIPKSLILALMMGLTCSGCAKKEEPIDHRTSANAQSESSAAPVASIQPVTSETSTSTASDFDINKVPVVNPQLGKFPYFSLIEGYQPGKGGDSKDVAFDRYEFFDGAKIETVEGRLTTTEAEGRGASPFQVFKTYESLVTGRPESSSSVTSSPGRIASPPIKSGILAWGKPLHCGRAASSSARSN